MHLSRSSSNMEMLTLGIRTIARLPVRWRANRVGDDANQKGTFVSSAKRKFLSRYHTAAAHIYHSANRSCRKASMLRKCNVFFYQSLVNCSHSAILRHMVKLWDIHILAFN